MTPLRRRKGETHILVPSKKFLGVFYDKEQEYWRVIVTTDDSENGSTMEGGHSHDEVEAAHMYDECVLDVKAGKPKLNFPDG